MDLYIYSDESGVFDREHNDFYVFGGVIFLGKEERDIASRKYIAAENIARTAEKLSQEQEVKAAVVSNAAKGKLYRSLNAYHKFGVVVHQKKVLDRIFLSKKDKQRFLDYVYKMGVKAKFQQMIHNGIIDPMEIEHLHFYVDEHTTATNGKYELRESLEQEFKRGTFSMNYMHHFPPIFSQMQDVKLEFCNSAAKTLIRAADIVANKVYYHAVTDNLTAIHDLNNLNILNLP